MLYDRLVHSAHRGNEEDDHGKVQKEQTQGRRQHIEKDEKGCHRCDETGKGCARQRQEGETEGEREEARRREESRPQDRRPQERRQEEDRSPQEDREESRARQKGGFRRAQARRAQARRAQARRAQARRAQARRAQAGGIEACRTEACRASCERAAAASGDASTAPPGDAAAAPSGGTSAGERPTRAPGDAAFRGSGAASGAAVKPTGERAVAELLASASGAHCACRRSLERTARAPAAGAHLYAYPAGGPASLVFALHAQHAGLERYRRRKKGLTPRT